MIPFAQFMELALYCPDCGYYEKEKDIGKHGDFITSVSVGKLFAQLLAFQFSEWLEPEIARDATIRIVEAGAHNGALARDILEWLSEHRAPLFDRVCYSILEPSLPRRARQKEALIEFGDRISWHAGLQDLATAAGGAMQGVIFSNELLDAMPVHRIAWDKRSRNWFEWGVAEENGNLVWRRMDLALPTVEIPKAAAELRDILPDGYVVEMSPAARRWWREAAAILQRGRLMTIDYGATDGPPRAERATGTLRAYSHHAVSTDLLAAPGEQDITAHIDFEMIRNAGEEQGLGTETLVSQEKFLTLIAARAWKPDSEFGEWTSAMGRQFQTLTHPDHFGRAFHVLVQSRGDRGSALLARLDSQV